MATETTQDTETLPPTLMVVFPTAHLQLFLPAVIEVIGWGWGKQRSKGKGGGPWIPWVPWLLFIR